MFLEHNPKLCSDIAGCLRKNIQKNKVQNLITHKIFELKVYTHFNFIIFLSFVFDPH